MRGVDIKSVLASTSAESAEVAALEEEMAKELAKEAGNKEAGNKGSGDNSPGLDDTPPITPAPSKHAQVDRYCRKLKAMLTVPLRRACLFFAAGIECTGEQLLP